MGSSVSNVSLLQQVRQVARRARRLLWIRSLVLVAAGALLFALLAILFDHGVHVDHRGLRWLVSLGSLGGWLAFAGRVLRPLVGLQLNEVNTARWMERAYPVLQDRLSSAIQVLRDAPRDAAAGSTDLRTALVQQATAQSAQLELDRVLDGRCIWRAAAWGAGAIVSWLALAVWSPIDVHTGLARLAVPWNPPRWPTLHHLSFDSLPSQVAQGESIRVRVVDTQRLLPSQVQLWYWPQGEDAHNIRRYDMRRADDASVWTLANIRQPFRIRAAGGDHQDMEWVSVNVVEAPALSEVRVSVEPPAYTGWPVEAVAADFSVLRGTRVWLHGRSTRPLREAWLAWRDETGQTARIPLSLSSDGRDTALDRSCSPQWSIAASAEYHLELLDRAGIRAAVHRGHVTAQADQAPTIELRQPDDDILVGPNSLVPLNVQVSDDLAVQQILLIYTRSDEEALPEHPLMLFDRTDPPRPRADVRQGADLLPVNFDWDLSQVSGLLPGTVVSWHLSATDNGGQQTQITTRHWTLSSEEQQLQEFAGQEQELLTQVHQIVLAQQRVQKTLQQTLQHRWQAGSVPSTLANQIEAVALAQRAVRETLTDSPASVLHELSAQQDAIRRSRIAAEARLQRQEDWVAQLAQLDQDALAKLDDALSSVLRDVSDGDPAPGLSARASDELQRAVPLQQHVVERLQTLVWELRQQDALQARVQQLQQLRTQQQTLFGETTALAEVTISRTVDSMPAAQRDKLRALVEQQLELARQAEQSVAGMLEAPAESEAAEAARLMAAQQAAVAGGLSARMRLAAQELQLNRVGNATQQQQAVDALLEQVLGLLQRAPQNTGHTPIATPTQQSDPQAEMQAALPAEPPRGNAAVPPAEIQLLAMLQRQLNQQTQECHDRLVAAGGSDDDAERQLKALAMQQGELAELLNRLLSAAAADTEAQVR